MRICLFDIDGTLIRSGGAGQLAFEKAMDVVFGIKATNHNVPFQGRTDRAIMGDLLAHCGVENTQQSWQLFLKAYLDHLPRCMDERDGNVLPGVVDLLDQLSQRQDVAVGLLTGNGAEAAQIKLGYYGIAHYFDFGGYGDHHCQRELVAQDAVSAARTHLGIPFENKQVCVIGDTPHDIRCGRAIGAVVVGVCTGSDSANELAATSPDLLIDNFCHKEPLLEVLFREHL